MFKAVSDVFNNAKKKVTDWMDSHPVEVAVIELIGFGAAVGGTAGLLIGKHSGYRKGFDARSKIAEDEKYDLYGFKPKTQYAFDTVECRNCSIDELLELIGTIDKSETLSGMLVRDNTVLEVGKF